VKLEWCSAIGVHLIGLEQPCAYLAAFMLYSRLVPCIMMVPIVTGFG
jgi:hypothetical protein